MFRILSFFGLWLIAGLLLVGPKAAAEDSQLWTAIAATGKTGQDRLLWWFDGHARFSDDAGRLGVSIIRPGLGWRVSDRLDLWAGYARVTAHPGANVDEDRFWQQATYSLGTVFGGKLSGRTRLEQRFRDSDSDTGWRIRQFVRWARKLPNSDFSIVLWNETFAGFNDADWGQRQGFDQNRAFVGFAWHAQDKLRAEAGYLNNIIDTPGSNLDNHNLSLTLFMSL